jgi:DNA-binding NarL/FixJ family response regulator
MAEAVAALNRPDAEHLCRLADDLVETSGSAGAEPQLLRARALLLMHRGELDQAIELLQASTERARSQHTVVELGQSLASIAAMAHRCGSAELANQADAERSAIVERLGTEARALSWAPGLSPTASKPTDAKNRGPFSRRESEVARLIRNGLSNRQIAATLVISERTVEHHVSNIMARLGLVSRAQVAVWAHEHELTAGR